MVLNDDFVVVPSEVFIVNCVVIQKASRIDQVSEIQQTYIIEEIQIVVLHLNYYGVAYHSFKLLENMQAYVFLLRQTPSLQHNPKLPCIVLRVSNMQLNSKIAENPLSSCIVHIFEAMYL